MASDGQGAVGGTKFEPIAPQQWLRAVLLGTLGALGVLALWALWHFIEREWPPPEELRWANGDLAYETTPAFKTIKAYPLSSPKVSGTEIEQSAWDLPNVAVYSAPNAKAPPSPLSLQNLSDAGQAHAIDFLSKDADKADAAWSQLSKTLTGTDSGMEKKDPYRADRVLIATVSKGVNAMPGDRLLWSRVFVQPINFEFAGYTVASTDTKAIKIAGIEDSLNSKLSLDFGLGAVLPGTGKDAPSLESAKKTTSEINQQYENLGVDIRPGFLRIIRESAVGGDVVGNTAINLSVLTDPKTIRSRADGTQAQISDLDIPALVVDEAHLTDGIQYFKGERAKILVHPQDVLPHCPLIAKVWMIYEMRKVERGHDNYLEGLQKVSLLRDGEPAHEVEIVPGDDIAPAVWSIKRHKTGGNLPEEPDLKATALNHEGRRVVSTDYVTVSELTHWLKADVSKEPLNDMTFDNADNETLVPFKNVGNDCQKSEH